MMIAIEEVLMKEKPDSFPSVMAKKIEDEAKIKRQQE